MRACHSERSRAKRRICFRHQPGAVLSALTGAMLLVLNGCGGGPTAGDGPPPPPPSLSASGAFVFPASGTGPSWGYAIAGQGAFTLQVTGSGFTNSSVVEWNGTPLPGTVTAFSSSTDVFATVSIHNVITICVLWLHVPA